MWRFWLRRVGRFALGLLGAAFFAACVSTLGEQTGASPAHSFSQLLIARIIAVTSLDFGVSGVSALPVWNELAKTLPATLELMGFGALIALLAGVPVGSLLSDRRVVRVGAPFLQLVSAMPLFCVALAFLWLSQHLLHWTGTSGGPSLITAVARGHVGEIVAALRAIAAPAITVGIAGAYATQKAVRRAIDAASNEPYRKGLRALGLGRFEIDSLYLLPQILSTFFHGSGEIASSLIGATAVAEWVFAWPGIADLFLKSVALKDWTVAGVILFVFAAVTMTVEFAGAMIARFLAETGAAR